MITSILGLFRIDTTKPGKLSVKFGRLAITIEIIPQTDIVEGI